MAAPSTAQLLAALAALARSFQLPSPNGNQTGIRRTPANNLSVPLSTYNLQLGTNLVYTLSADGNYLDIALNVGDMCNGL